jgi:predicted ATP-dependent protease
VQAIGGVNEKVEGFFDVCAGQGFTGSQGVVIPQSNVRHLMLREDVVAAVAARRFHVYAVTRVDEALSLLTGTNAGNQDASGHYEENSVNARVANRLGALTAIRREFGQADKAVSGQRDE